MGSKKARVRNHRRDRRKAKESGWRRGPRRKMNSAVAHGETGSATIQGANPVKKDEKPVKNGKVAPSEGSAFSLDSSLWEGQDELMEVWQDLQEREAENYKEAFHEGTFAYWHDTFFHDNPYGCAEQASPRFEVQFQAWRDGWNTAELEISHGVTDEVI